MQNKCHVCHYLRKIFIALICGAVAGGVAVWLDGSDDQVMLATFLTAVLPMAWMAHRERK